MLVYYFVPFIVSNRYLLFWVSNGHNSVTVQNRTHVYINFFHHKYLGNHLLQLCPKVVKHPVFLFQVFKIKFLYAYMNDLKTIKLSKYIAIIHKRTVRSIYSYKAIERTAVELQWLTEHDGILY